MIHVRLQAEPFDAGAELARLDSLGGGGVASFTGIVRGDDGLTELLLEHHPEMTLAMMQALAVEAVERWKLLGTTIIHRHGVSSRVTTSRMRVGFINVITSRAPCCMAFAMISSST